MKKIFFSAMAAILVFSLFPGQILAQGEPDLLQPHWATYSPDETLHFVMTIQWGNVQGEPTTREEANFDGSVYNAFPATQLTTRISLIRALQFEHHNGERDKITSEANPVSWQSLIYGQWDGVQVLISAKASDVITTNINIGGGQAIMANKTAEELYNQTEPAVTDAGNGREIVTKTHPYQKRQFMMTMFWGDGPTGQQTDFSGSATLAGGSEGVAKKTLRFETQQGDQITAKSSTQISWKSTITGDRDGITARIKFDKVVDDNDTLTVNFTNLGLSMKPINVPWTKTYKLIDIYHNRITKETITILPATETQPYHLIIAVKTFPNRKLVKIKNQATVYMIEDETKRPVLSAEVFAANNLNWGEVEGVDQDELDSYAEGEALNYPDGTLVQGSSSAVYIISDGTKRPFSGPSAFLGLGYKWSQVKKIRDAELSRFVDEAAVKEISNYPEGTILKEKNKETVYVVRNNQRMALKAQDLILPQQGKKWDRIVEVDKAAMNKLEEATTNESYPDGTLVKGSGAGIYLVDKGEKRPFKAADDFTSLKYKWSQVKTISDQELAAVPTGTEMVGE